MNGYAKIRVASSITTKSRSNTVPNPTSKAQETLHINTTTTTTTTTHDSFSDQEDHHHEEEENKKGFGGVLKRNSSVSSSSKTTTAVKWAFSMKRSSSVSERYCRIHDQSVTLAPSSSPQPFIDDDDDDDDDDGGVDEVKMEKMQTRSMKKKHRKSKIIKACKRLFGV